MMAAENARAVFYDSIPTVMVMEESPQPRDTFVLKRGAYDNHGEKVTPGVPAILAAAAARVAEQPPGPGAVAGGSRQSADGARDGEPLLADVFRHGPGEDGPGLRLAGRVAHASRICSIGWQSKFMDSGWNVKALQKTIVMSATYRQSSTASLRSCCRRIRKIGCWRVVRACGWGRR